MRKSIVLSLFAELKYSTDCRGITHSSSGCEYGIMAFTFPFKLQFSGVGNFYGWIVAFSVIVSSNSPAAHSHRQECKI